MQVFFLLKSCHSWTAVHKELLFPGICGEMQRAQGCPSQRAAVCRCLTRTAVCKVLPNISSCLSYVTVHVIVTSQSVSQVEMETYMVNFWIRSCILFNIELRVVSSLTGSLSSLSGILCSDVTSSHWFFSFVLDMTIYQYSHLKVGIPVTLYYNFLNLCRKTFFFAFFLNNIWFFFWLFLCFLFDYCHLLHYLFFKARAKRTQQYAAK